MIKPFQSKVPNHDQKNIAFTVMALKSKSTAEHQKTSNAFGVTIAKKRLFIREQTINTFAKNDGLTFGSTKATRFEGFPDFPATAPLKSNRSKITGSLKPQKKTPTFQRSNMPFMTALTLEEATALWFS